MIGPIVPATLATIALRRLRNQRLVGPPLADPAAVVEHLLAVQAQDYPAASWGVAQRTRGATAADVDRALSEGLVLRTHVLRPTWHLVPASDIRWLLALTAPRVLAQLATYDRRLGLDARTYRRSNDAMARAVEGGRHLTRTELSQALARAGLDARGQKLGHLVMRAELDAVICSGAIRGKQHTYALLAERAPHARSLARDEALAQLSLRYVSSHGPALAQDLAWWAGLTVADAKAGLAAAGLETLVVDGRTFHHAGGPAPRAPRGPPIHLLPNYDEQLIAYRDHAVGRDPAFADAAPFRTAVLGGHVITRGGRAIGGWRRTITPRGVSVRTRTSVRLPAEEQRAIRAQAERYARFLGLPLAS